MAVTGRATLFGCIAWARAELSVPMLVFLALSSLTSAGAYWQYQSIQQEARSDLQLHVDSAEQEIKARVLRKLDMLVGFQSALGMRAQIQPADFTPLPRACRCHSGYLVQVMWGLCSVCRVMRLRRLSGSSARTARPTLPFSPKNSLGPTCGW